MAPAVAEALARLRAAGWRLVLISGRSLDDLLRAFPDARVCDLVVAEDGGVLADVAPTILDLMNLPRPADMEGRSLIEHEGEGR